MPIFPPDSMKTDTAFKSHRLIACHFCAFKFSGYEKGGHEKKFEMMSGFN